MVLSKCDLICDRHVIKFNNILLRIGLGAIKILIEWKGGVAPRVPERATAQAFRPSEIRNRPRPPSVAPNINHIITDP